MASADARVHALAARQDGVISRGQLLRAGVSEAQIAWRLRCGRLLALHRSVYLVAGATITFRGRIRAALLACGAGAVVSHWTAAALWGIHRERPGAVELSTTGVHCARPHGVSIHRPRRLPASELRTRDGFRCTSPVRTICDLAAAASRTELEFTVQEAAVRRLVSAEELAGGLEKMQNRPGAVMLRSIQQAEDGGGFTRSQAERRLLALIDGAGLPRPEKNVRIGGHRVDAVWPQQRLIVEIDGFQTHGTAVAFAADRAMDAELTVAGWRVLRFTARQLREQPLVVVARIAQMLGGEAAV